MLRGTKSLRCPFISSERITVSRHVERSIPDQAPRPTLAVPTIHFQEENDDGLTGRAVSKLQCPLRQPLMFKSRAKEHACAEEPRRRKFPIAVCWVVHFGGHHSTANEVTTNRAEPVT